MHMDEGLQCAKRQYRQCESFSGRTSNSKNRQRPWRGRERNKLRGKGCAGTHDNITWFYYHDLEYYP